MRSICALLVSIEPMRKKVSFAMSELLLWAQAPPRNGEAPGQFPGFSGSPTSLPRPDLGSL